MGGLPGLPGYLSRFQWKSRCKMTKCGNCGKKCNGYKGYFKGKSVCSSSCFERLRNKDKYVPIKTPKWLEGYVRKKVFISSHKSL